MDPALGSETGAADERQRLRQLRWFKKSFRHDATLISKRYGLSIEVDEGRLAGAFLNWADVFGAQRAYAAANRRDIVFLAAGLLLRELSRSRPVRMLDEWAGPPSKSQIRPEGFIYANYCLCVLGAVLEREGQPLDLGRLADDLKAWLSYRAGGREEASAAIAVLDLFTGSEPNWWTPDSVLSRAAVKRAVAARIMPLDIQPRARTRAAPSA